MLICLDALFRLNLLLNCTFIECTCMLQVTAILTPLLATAAGEQPTKNMWIGCCIALVSTVLITLDSHSGGQGASQVFAVSPGESWPNL